MIDSDGGPAQEEETPAEDRRGANLARATADP